MSRDGRRTERRRRWRPHRSNSNSQPALLVENGWYWLDFSQSTQFRIRTNQMSKYFRSMGGFVERSLVAKKRATSEHLEESWFGRYLLWLGSILTRETQIQNTKLNQEWNASRNSIGASMTSSRTAVWVISMIDSLFSNGDLSCQDPAATGHSKQRPKGSRTQLCPKQNPITPIWKAYTTWFFAVSSNFIPKRWKSTLNCIFTPQTV